VYGDECFIWKDANSEWSWFTDEEDIAALATKGSKGERWTVIYAGTKDGWVPNALFLRTKKRGDDWNGCMDAKLYQKWFKEYLLEYLPPRSLIILDNASFHKATEFKLSEMEVPALQERLRLHNVAFSEKASTAALKRLVRAHCPLRPVVETLAEAKGHEVVWLPPYHPILNPIERLWGVVKNSVRAQTTIHSVSEDVFLERLNVAFESVGEAQWSGSVTKSYNAARNMVDIDEVESDALHANTAPARATSAHGDVREHKTERAPAKRAVDYGSEARHAASAAAAAADDDPVPRATTAAEPTRHSSRKRVASRKKAEAAADSDDEPPAQRRKR